MTKYSKLALKTMGLVVATERLEEEGYGFVDARDFDDGSGAQWYEKGRSKVRLNLGKDGHLASVDFNWKKGKPDPEAA